MAVFSDLLVSREHRFALGVLAGTGQHYLLIPVANRRVDYEEYYRIDPETFARSMADPNSALPLLERCRRRQEDALLSHAPGADRGTAG